MNAFIGHSSNGMGLANNAVLLSLLDCLLTKQILAPAEVVDILETARAGLLPNDRALFVKDAIELISKLSAVYRRDPLIIPSGSISP